MASASSHPVRFEGAPEDPLLRADIAKRDEAEGAPNDGAAENEPTERPAEKDSAENVEAAVDKTTVPIESEASREKALAKEHLVRSVLSTRICIPSPESASNRVLRAVLRGDAEGLTKAIQRKRLKGVAVALTADDRKRTALHMAVCTMNVRMVRALMQWRRELNRSLEDELDSLSQRRDMFIQGFVSSSTTAGWSSLSGGETAKYDIDRFEKWLSEERRRLVRVTELRCEECWRKAVTARDSGGRTCLHYAAAAAAVGADETLFETLLTTGRADLCARDASNDRDQATFAALKEMLNLAPSSNRESKNAASDDRRVGNTHQCAGENKTANPLVFPGGGEFHRRTGKLRRCGSRMGRGKAETKREAKGSGDEQAKLGSGSRRGPDGLTAGTAKVKWFCAALERTAEKLSGRKGGGAEAFLLSVFEDFDRRGDGTLSMQRFRQALEDVNVRVSEQTLLEVGRYFQAPTLKYRRSQHGHRDREQRNTLGSRGTAFESAPVEMSYVPLMDIVFGRKCVKEPASKVLVDGEDATDDGQGDGEGESKGRDVRREMDPPLGSRAGKDRDERTGDDDRCYVNVGRIRAARVAVIETPDALGRSPLFLAAAAGSVPAVKTLIRHGAASSLAVEGTDLTPYSVAPSSLMRRVLAAEARHSLYQAMSKRNNGHHPAAGVAAEEENQSVEKENAGHDLAASFDNPARAFETRRMETWVSTLAEAEQAMTSAGEVRADQKTSLHLAAAAGLPEAVKGLLGRGLGESKDGGRPPPATNRAGGEFLTLPPAWKMPWKPPERLDTAHRALDHHAFSQGSSNTGAHTTDANGWSALHACCDEPSPQHYSCALALLGAQGDPNARTNTGKTPLHVAASATSSAEIRGGGDLIPLLVSHGADLEARDGEGLRPIHVAAKTGRHAALYALLAAGTDAWSVTPRRWNALHYSVAGGFLEATRLLAYWDADSGVLGRQKNSAGVAAMDLGRTNEIRSAIPSLWEAAALGDVEHVSRACLESSRSSKDTTGKSWACPGVNHKTPGLGFTPLHACMAGLAAATRGVDVCRPCTPPRPRGQRNIPSRPSLYACLAREHGRPTGSRGDKSNKNNGTGSPGSIGNYVRVCRTLLSAAADVEALDVRRRTPLALGAAAGSLEVVEMLIRAGADARAVDVDGNTPLHFAFAYAHVEVGAMLSERGADMEARNGSGKTPQDVAGLCSDLAPTGECGGDAL